MEQNWQMERRMEQSRRTCVKNLSVSKGTQCLLEQLLEQTLAQTTNQRLPKTSRSTGRHVGWQSRPLLLARSAGDR